jgi:hypothetical protein
MLIPFLQRFDYGARQWVLRLSESLRWFGRSHRCLLCQPRLLESLGGMGKIARGLRRSGLVRRSRPHGKSWWLSQRERQPVGDRDSKPACAAQKTAGGLFWRRGCRRFVRHHAHRGCALWIQAK